VVDGERLPIGDTSVTERISEFIFERSLTAELKKNTVLSVVYLDNLADKTVRIYYVLINGRDHRFRMRNDLILFDRRKLARGTKLHKLETANHVAYCTEPEIGPGSICVIPNPMAAKKYAITELKYMDIFKEMYVDLQWCIPSEEKELWRVRE